MQPVPKQTPAKPIEPVTLDPKLLTLLREMQASADRWSDMEEKIKEISTEDDLEVIKAKLCADVATARAEALQDRKKISDLFSGVMAKLDLPPLEASQSGASIYTLDQLTGLPARAYAETELSRAHAQTEDCYLALFIVKRLALINAKFGYSRGNQVLLKVVTQLAQSMPDLKSLFRWAPCAFLAMAPPSVSYKELRSKVHVIEITRMTPVLEWEGHSAMVPVTLDCRIISLKDFETPSDLFLRLDTLAADA